MIIIGFEKLSLVNYDGEVSAILFLSGCNFRCPFCQNYEFVVPDGEDYKIYSEEEILSYLKKRFGLLSAVVISGGEPTLNKDLKPFIANIKSIGYKIKLDTNGSNPELLKDLFESGLIDYAAVDIKNSIDMYSKTIGIKNYDTSSVEKTVSYLINSSYDYEFRTTLMKDYHTDESINEMGKWIKGAKKLFLQRYEESEFVPDKSIKEVDKETTLKYRDILLNYVKEVKIRGWD